MGKIKKQTQRPKGEQEQPGLFGRLVRGFLKLVWGFAWRSVAVLLLIVAGATAYYYAGLQGPENLFEDRQVGSVTLKDQQGEIFAWRGEQYGGDLRATDVSPHLVNAVIATEDKRFYNHFGLDPRGIARAMYNNWRAGRLVQGGSTITQQVAKNVFLDATRTVERKLKEVPMALALELKYSKEEILSVYLNRVYLGAGTFGFEAAAQRYFGKSARILNPAESAMLAGLLKAPSRYAPTNDLATAQGRASVIIRLMEDQGYLNSRQVIEALSNPAQLSDAAASSAGGAFADWLLDRGGQDRFFELIKAEDVEITTTFDPVAQAAAEAALVRVFEERVRTGSQAEAAIVIMTHDGAVRAMVGGRTRGAARFNRATQAMRQTGSAFKAVVYAAGLEAGMGPLDTIQDAPLRIGTWTPQNYGGDYMGPITVKEALARSVNTAAVRALQYAGEDRVRALAEEMGITSELAPGPAIALGTSEARLIEMTGVFATIANGGRRVTPHGIQAIYLRGDATPIDARDRGPSRQVISPRTAGLMTHMLKAVVESGTGRRARLPGWEVAGKTGTTQRARDAWFIGYSAEYVAGVWMGYDDNSPLTGVTGGGLPAEIWREVMVALHQELTPKPLNEVMPSPPQVIAATPVSASGDTVVERVFRDVLDGLSGGGGGSGQDWEPQAGNDR
ncbi:MAG: PBP1A family penicillin-binding protein [Pseudomonadota bacterium]